MTQETTDITPEKKRILNIEFSLKEDSKAVFEKIIANQVKIIELYEENNSLLASAAKSSLTADSKFQDLGSLKSSDKSDTDTVWDKLNSLVIEQNRKRSEADEAKLQELDYLWDTMYSIFSKLQSHYRPTVLSSDSKAIIEREVDESVKKYREEIKQKLSPE